MKEMHFTSYCALHILLILSSSALNLSNLETFDISSQKFISYYADRRLFHRWGGVTTFFIEASLILINPGFLAADRCNIELPHGQVSFKPLIGRIRYFPNTCHLHSDIYKLEHIQDRDHTRRPMDDEIKRDPIGSYFDELTPGSMSELEEENEEIWMFDQCNYGAIRNIEMKARIYAIALIFTNSQISELPIDTVNWKPETPIIGVQNSELITKIKDLSLLDEVRVYIDNVPVYDCSRLKPLVIANLIGGAIWLFETAVWLYYVKHEQYTRHLVTRLHKLLLLYPLMRVFGAALFAAASVLCPKFGCDVFQLLYMMYAVNNAFSKTTLLISLLLISYGWHITRYVLTNSEKKRMRIVLVSIYLLSSVDQFNNILLTSVIVALNVLIMILILHNAKTIISRLNVRLAQAEYLLSPLVISGISDKILIFRVVSVMSLIYLTVEVLVQLTIHAFPQTSIVMMWIVEEATWLGVAIAIFPRNTYFPFQETLELHEELILPPLYRLVDTAPNPQTAGEHELVVIINPNQDSKGVASSELRSQSY